jgi:Bacterial PH domain
VSGQTGSLRKRGIDTALSKIEGITIERDLGGSLFGYGTVVVRGVGGSRVGFRYISNHEDFRQSLDSEIFTECI